MGSCASTSRGPPTPQAVPRWAKKRVVPLGLEAAKGAATPPAPATPPATPAGAVSGAGAGLAAQAANAAAMGLPPRPPAGAAAAGMAKVMALLGAGPVPIASQLAAAGERFAGSPAITFDGPGPRVVYTYAELDARSNRVARNLAARGVGARDVVVTVCENRPEQVILLCAALKMGAVMTPLAEDLSDGDLTGLLDMYQPKVIMLGPGRGAPRRAGGGTWADAVVALPRDPKRGEGEWDRLEEDGSAAPLDGVDLDAPGSQRGRDEVGIIFSTSGSTALPKGVEHSVFTLSLLGDTQRIFALAGVPSPGGGAVQRGDARLVTEPMRGVGAVIGVLTTLPYGGHVVLNNAQAYGLPDGPKVWQRLIDTHGVKRLLLFGQAMHQVVTELHGRGTLPSVREVSYGGSCFPASLTRRCMEVFGNAVFSQGYAMSEVFPICSLLPYHHFRPSAEDPDLVPTWWAEDQLGIMATAGPVSGLCQVFLERTGSDAEGRPYEMSGEQVGEGEEGQVCVRSLLGPGALLMMGYHKNPQKTAEAVGKDGFLRTGDLGRFTQYSDYMTGKPLLQVTGRCKDTIPHHKGFMLAPRDIEDVISLLPAVGEVAVVGVTHPTGAGEMVACYVTPKAGAALTAGELAAHCRARGLAAARGQIPELWVISDEGLPVRGGKAARALLRSRAHLQRCLAERTGAAAAARRPSAAGPLRRPSAARGAAPCAAPKGWAPRHAVFRALDVDGDGAVCRAELDALLGAGDAGGLTDDVAAAMGVEGGRLSAAAWRRFVDRVPGGEARRTFLTLCQVIVAGMQNEPFTQFAI